MEGVNAEHGITPQTVIHSIDDSLATITNADYFGLTNDDTALEGLEFTNQIGLAIYIQNLESD